MSAELTLSLGNRQPFGVAVGAAFGEDFGSNAFEGRIATEIAIGPNGWAFSAMVRPYLALYHQQGYGTWNYMPSFGSYTELGYTVRLRTWSGLRLGGGLQSPVGALRLHAMIPMHAQPVPIRESNDPLPLPQRRPNNLATNDIKLAFAFEPWLLPSVFGSVYGGYY